MRQHVKVFDNTKIYVLNSPQTFACGNLSGFHASHTPREDRFAIFHGYSKSDIIRVASDNRSPAGMCDDSKFPDTGGCFSRNDELRMAQRDKHEPNCFINERLERKPTNYVCVCV